MNRAKLVIAVAALLGSGTALAQVPQWTVSESSGSVSILRPGYSGAAARGGTVKAGDTVSTGKNGRAVLVRGEEYLVVSPGSRIVVADPKPGQMTQIIQSLGNTLFKIKKMATPHFAVQTPYLAAVVKGTTFSVTVTETGASVQVTEGRVQVQTPDGGASYLVTPGVIGAVNRNQPYRLKVHGRESLTIDSPAAPAGAGPDQAAPATEATEVSYADTITTTVGEGSVSLATLSGGLVSGDSTLVAAATTQRPVQVAIAQTVGSNEVSTAALPPTPAETDVAAPTGVPIPIDSGAASGGGTPAAAPVEVATGSAGIGGAPDAGTGAPAIETASAGTIGAAIGSSGGAAGGAPDPAIVTPVVEIANAGVAGAVVGSSGGVSGGATVDPGVGSANAGGNGNGNNGNGLGNGGGNGSNGNGAGNGNANGGASVSAGAGAAGAGLQAGIAAGGNGNGGGGVSAGVGVGSNGNGGNNGNGNGNNGNGLGNGGGSGSNGNGNGFGLGASLGLGNNNNDNDDRGRGRGNGNGNGNGNGFGGRPRS